MATIYRPTAGPAESIREGDGSTTQNGKHRPIAPRNRPVELDLETYLDDVDEYLAQSAYLARFSLSPAAIRHR